MQVPNIRIITTFIIACGLVLSACGSIAPENNTGGASTPTATAPAAGSVSGPAAQPEATATAPAPAPDASPAQAEATAPAAVPSTGNAASIPADTVAAFPDPAGFAWQPVVAGFERPLDLAFPPDNTAEMYVLEQPGVIRLVENGALLPGPLLDIRDRVGTTGNERGLLGIALHPQFAENGYFYVNYTDKRGHTVIARFQRMKENPNSVDPGTEKILLQVEQPFKNHNGGSMVFGPDGYLYIGLGDGGSSGDPQGNGQSLDTLLGKLLRIDVDGGDPYAVPADNPFAAGGGKPEIWAYGLRNPWRFSFDRLLGDLYIADVGQNAWEEVNYLSAGSPGGANFGWKYREAAHAFEGKPPAGASLIDPVAEYAHGQGCSVTGGFVYWGEALPEFRGVYLYSDYCNGRIWGLLKDAAGSWQSRVLFETGFNVSSFGEDRQGELYIIDQGSGAVYRLQRK